MAALTSPELRQMMRNGVGVEDGVDLDGDIDDTTFDELGYDSLAVLELAGRIGQVYGVMIPDERLWELRTPRAVIDHVNADLAAAAPAVR
jgi:act minimal PKS acyl carrier protein